MHLHATKPLLGANEQLSMRFPRVESNDDAGDSGVPDLLYQLDS